MKKMIIGVHGLANKPEKAILQEWWLEAINEGLEWMGYAETVSPETFELLYWADMVYVKPLSVDEPADSPFHLQQTYKRVREKPREYKEGVLDWVRRTVSDRVDNVLDNIGMLDKVASAIVAMKLKDLGIYWDPVRALHGNQTAKDALCNSLKEVLQEKQDCEIILIAHSMGSIIAFDTLAENRTLSVHTLITIGSPLGLPRVKRRASKRTGRTWPEVPPNVAKWINFADRRDPVALDTSLRRDYLTSERKRFVKDDLVFNEYEYEDKGGKSKANPHKSYGYLRCPEVTRATRDFLIKP